MYIDNLKQDQKIKELFNKIITIKIICHFNHSDQTIMQTLIIINPIIIIEFEDYVNKINLKTINFLRDKELE